VRKLEEKSRQFQTLLVFFKQLSGSQQLPSGSFKRHSARSAVKSPLFPRIRNSTWRSWVKVACKQRATTGFWFHTL